MRRMTGSNLGLPPLMAAGSASILLAGVVLGCSGSATNSSSPEQGTSGRTGGPTGADGQARSEPQPAGQRFFEQRWDERKS
jgi:hypothetical protein